MAVLLNNVNLEDPVQHEAAREVMEAILLPPIIEQPAVPTPTTTIGTGTTIKAKSTTQAPETTAGYGESDSYKLAKTQLSLQGVMTTMMNVDKVKGIVSPRDTELRLALTIVAAKVRIFDHVVSRVVFIWNISIYIFYPLNYYWVRKNKYFN